MAPAGDLRLRHTGGSPAKGRSPSIVTEIAAAGGTLSFLWLLPSPIPGFRSLVGGG